MHYYVWLRLAHDPALPQPWPAVLAVLLGLLGVSVFVAFARALPKPLAAVVHEVAFTWFGVLFLLDTTLALGDLARTIFFASARALTLAPEAPLAAARTQAWATVAVAMGLCAFAWWSAHREPALVEVPVKLAGWPRALQGLRIVQLSDVHVSPSTRAAEMRRLVERVNALSPDLVALTGDLVDGTPRLLADAVAPFGELRARLGVYFVTGNHEYYSGGDAWVTEFRRLGLRVLQNERVSLHDRGATFDLVGVPDWTGHQFGPAHRANLAGTLAGHDPATPSILLAHQPRQFPEAAKLGVSLQLSGHTHGGQIWPFTLVVGLVEKRLAGLHREGGSQLYVLGGTKYWGPPMRLGARHELTLLTLEAAS